ncbi:MAG TPA: sigma-70 factor domain-containing protein, partial [Pirellulales bacterium]
MSDHISAAHEVTPIKSGLPVARQPAAPSAMSAMPGAAHDRLHRGEAGPPEAMALADSRRSPNTNSVAPGHQEHSHEVTADVSGKKIPNWRTKPDVHHVTNLGGEGVSEGQPTLPIDNRRNDSCGRKSTQNMQIEPIRGTGVSSQALSTSNVVLPPERNRPAAAPVVLQGKGTAGERIAAESSPFVQEQHLAKPRKIAGRKPALRAPTPPRGRGRFSRTGAAPGGIATGGKAGAGRGALNGEAVDRRTPAYEDDNAFESDFVDAEDQELDETAVEETVGEGEGSASQIDDPVRIYLMQMGEIPLLTRPEEIESAKRIESTRRRFRHSMLASDFLLQGAVGLLEKVRDGKLRLDRTIEVSVTNTVGKKKIIARLGPNLKTLTDLLRRNRTDFCTAISRSTPLSKRRAAWHRLVIRRRKAVRLIEELNLRTGR